MLVIRNHGYLKRGAGARFLTADLERKTGIPGVPFGRTEVSIPVFSSFFELYRTGTVP